MKVRNVIAALSVATLIAGGSIGCDDNDSAGDRVERAGEKVEDAGEKTKDAVKDATD